MTRPEEDPRQREQDAHDMGYDRGYEDGYLESIRAMKILFEAFKIEFQIPVENGCLLKLAREIVKNKIEKKIV